MKKEGRTYVKVKEGKKENIVKKKERRKNNEKRRKDVCKSQRIKERKYSKKE